MIFVFQLFLLVESCASKTTDGFFSRSDIVLCSVFSFSRSRDRTKRKFSGIAWSRDFGVYVTVQRCKNIALDFLRKEREDN